MGALEGFSVAGFPTLDFGVSCFSVSSVLGPGSPKVWPKLFVQIFKVGGGGVT